MATRLSLAPDETDFTTPTLGLRQVGHLLGQYGSEASLKAYVSRLEADHGFPAPLPLHWRGEWVSGVHHRSRWPRASVDKWFTDRLPPAAAAAVEDAAVAQAAVALDANADHLVARHLRSVPDTGRDLPGAA